MSSVAILSLFAIFGAVSGFYLSVVGFAVTCLSVCLVVGLASAVFGGPFTAWLLFGAFLAQQVGFFLAVTGRAFCLRLLRIRDQRGESSAKAEFQAERDRIG